MKRNFLLALIGALCCVLQAFADVAAPTFPAIAVPEGGGTYYLYNVATKKYFCFDESKSNPKLDEFGTAVQLEGTTSSFTFKMGSIYMRGSYYLEKTDKPNDNSYWTLEATEAGYKLRNLKNTDTYLGTSESDNPELRGGVNLNTEWQFIPVNEASTLYQGQQSLYNALTAAEATGKGYDQTYFEQVYHSATATREEMISAANMLNAGVSNASKYKNCSWNEYPFLIMSKKGKFSSDEFYAAKDVNLFVNTDEQAFVTYRLAYSANDNPIEVYVDGKLVRTIDGYEPYSDTYFTERLTVGSHTVVWKVKQENYEKKTFTLQRVAVVAMPLISVSLLEPGSLGTEVLYNVDHLKKVKALKIEGTMNADDWSKLSMMTSLTYLDLSEANIQSIPERQFSDGKYPFLNEVKLPKTLKRIEDQAFVRSPLELCELPENIEYIGQRGLSSTLLSHINVPSSIKELGEHAFYDCPNLRKAVLPDNLKTLPRHLFENCWRLSECNLPNQLETIDNSAFCNCQRLAFSEMPNSLRRIGEFAMQNTSSTKIVVPQNVSIGSKAFSANYRLVEIELPVNVFGGISGLFSGCSALNKVTLRSATVLQNPDQLSLDLSKVTIVVPDYLVNSYKLDSYWYNAKAIEGFSTEDVKDWQIYRSLVLGARDRFKGIPNVGVRNGGSLKVNGDAPMTINDFYTETHGNEMQYTAQMWSKCDNVSINGKVCLGYYTSANSWYYISLPFNAKVSDITTQNNAQFAVRYYDGAARAANGVGASWKNYHADDIITAGTGFILQTNKEGWVYFNGQDDESKQYIVSNKEFVKKLEANISTIPANNGWNLVGNPYQSYYNAHKLNFTAPITLWDRNNRTYKAYSLIDDDIAIQPSQAFFVQCPDEVESISFPLEGRQLTSVIESQTAAAPMNPIGAPVRQIADIELSQGDLVDQTRVVINDEASMAYEMACDASKFMSDDQQVPQLYSLDYEGLAYAINERPLADGEVALGFYAAQEGVFTLKAKRNNFEHLFLIDHVTGTTTDIASQAYHFSSEAGTFNARFTLSVMPSSEVTGVDDVVATQQSIQVNGNAVTLVGNGMANIFTTDGKQYGQYTVTGEQTITLPIGVYVVSFNHTNTKVTINR